MLCPDELELARWLDGVLPKERADAIGLHLSECLECRLSVGTPADALSSTPHATGPSLSFPPFERIQKRLREAYHSRPEPDLPFLDPLMEDEGLVLMAADTDSHPNVASIPSLYGEEGNLVTFRVDAQGRVTAFFVSERDEWTRFRALRVGESWFLSDAEGRTLLSGLTAEQVIGKEISIPNVLASADCQYAGITGSGVRIEIKPAGGGEAPGVHLDLRTAIEADRPALILRLEGLPSCRAAVVVVSDDRDARLLLLSEGEEASTIWKMPPPRALRFDLIDRA